MKTKPDWKIKREQELKSKLNCFLFYLTMIGVTFAILAFAYYRDNVATPSINTETEVETETETELIRYAQDDYRESIDKMTISIEEEFCIYEREGYWYIYCVVTEVNEDTYVVQMPWNEYEEFYMIQDPPIDEFGNPDFTVVVFKVPKELLNDYDKYVVINVI